MKRAQLSRGITILFAVLSISAFAEQNPRFQVTANGADPITPIGGKNVFGVGFYADTTYPLSRPFSSQVAAGGTQDMRFQVPVEFGVEASWGITRAMEVALSFGYDNFKTQNFRSQSGETKVFDIAQYTMYPVMALFRYRFPRNGWAPEAEAGLGTAFGSIEIRETKQNGQSFTSSGPFYRGHLAGGAAFSWAENASLHFLIGYGFNHLGNKTYDGDGATEPMHIEQKGDVQGVFTKAYLKFYF